MRRALEIPFRKKQYGHANFSGLMSMFQKPKKPAATTVDPALEPKVDATGKPLPNQNIDPATGKLRKANTDPNAPENIVDPNKSKNPLDVFDGLWDNTNKSGTVDAPSFSLDPEALKTVAGKLSFAPQLTAEQLEKFKTGDPETIAALLNETGRQAYTSLMQHIPALTDKYVTARLQHDRAGLGRSVRTELTVNSLEKLASKNPVLKQQLDRVVAGLYEKYPDATPDWVAEQSTKYFVDIAKQLSPDSFKPTAAEAAVTPKEGEVPEDFWANFVTSQPSKTTP